MPSPLLGFGLSRRAVLQHHLQYNHYPPIDPWWLESAEAAIDLAVEIIGNDEDQSMLNTTVIAGDKTALDLLDDLHLWSFVEHGLADQADYDDENADDYPEEGGE